MWLRKDQAGSAPGHTWDKDGDVLEVDDALGAELLAIPGGGFTEVAPHELPKGRRGPARTPVAE